MEKFTRLFGRRYPIIIGMVHVRPLPGTPRYGGGNGIKDIILQASKEAEIYKKSGVVDAILLENMHDTPYAIRQVGPEIVASMAAVCNEVKNIVKEMPCGIQILAGCNTEALAVAKACNLDFIRAEGFVFSHVADEGLMNADAGCLLRYRKMIDAENVLVFTDIKKKHSSHAITQDVDLVDTAKGAEFFLSDGVIITGSHTGDPANPDHVKQLKQDINIPVVVGSGVTDENISEYTNADAIIVGSYFKERGFWKNDICQERISSFRNSLNKNER